MANVGGEWMSNLADDRIRVVDTGGPMVTEYWGNNGTAFIGPREQVERLIELGYWTRWEDPTQEPEEETVGADIQRIGEMTDKIEEELATTNARVLLYLNEIRDILKTL